jgi:hypothetical protein
MILVFWIFLSGFPMEFLLWKNPAANLPSSSAAVGYRSPYDHAQTTPRPDVLREDYIRTARLGSLKS